MAGKYTELVEKYCRDKSIDIPSGFYRHNASHLIVIRMDQKKPKLVAKTFFKKTDLNYYLKTMVIEDEALEEIAKVLDFKNDKRYVVVKNRKLNEL